MKPHKHAELIKAWADGAEIECKNSDGTWFISEYPTWSDDCEYRIKPEPKPEPVKVTMYIYNNAHTGATWIDEIHPKQRVESIYSKYMGSIEVLK